MPRVDPNLRLGVGIALIDHGRIVYEGGVGVRCLLEILYDGHEEAAADLKAQAAQMETSRVALRRRLTIPPAPADLAQIGSVYTGSGDGHPGSQNAV